MHTNKLKYRSRWQYHFIQSTYILSFKSKSFYYTSYHYFNCQTPFSQEVQEQIVYNITLIFVLIILGNI
jgi:hypothetical protein